MRIHANARTCPNSRRLLVRRIEEERWSLTVAAETIDLGSTCEPTACRGSGSGSLGTEVRTRDGARRIRTADLLGAMRGGDPPPEARNLAA